MATKLHGTDRIVINQLFDTGVFTSTPSNPTGEMKDAIDSLKKTASQQRINNYLKDLIGVQPENVQENLLLLIGSNNEDAETVHVLLATFKAVINQPELQGEINDRAVLVKTIVRQVQSEVTELDEKEIRRLITKLFEDQLKLFTLDYPEFTQKEQNQEVDEYWNINPDFVLVVQAFIDKLMDKQRYTDLTDIQLANQQLLLNRYLSPKLTPRSWKTLMDNKEKILSQWNNLERFDLECGDDYALLLDKKRQPLKSKNAIVAIVVAHEIHSGIVEDDLNQLIKQTSKELFSDSKINPSQVKDSLAELGLIEIRNDFVFPTPLVKRFTVEEAEVGSETNE